MRRLSVLFAPDYRAGNPYQKLLADALSAYCVDVKFPSGYRRGLPLFRGVASTRPDIVHLHWPQAYFGKRNDRWDRLRVARYPLDHWLTARRYPVVTTAHNLLPHNRGGELGVRRNMRTAMGNAQAIFAHSRAAKEQLVATFGIPDDRIVQIPFGDHSIALGRPVARDRARDLLALPREEKVCLMFGTVSPYKGIAEMLEFWAAAKVNHRLVVVGPVLSQNYAALLRHSSRNSQGIDLRLSGGWLSDGDLCAWLSAADCAIFNYREVFSSGAAALARSYGLPVVIPSRHQCVDLDEPHSHVFRFDALETDFLTRVENALSATPDYHAAEEWRRKTSWSRVAELTAAVYAEVVARCKKAVRTYGTHGEPERFRV